MSETKMTDAGELVRLLPGLHEAIEHYRSPAGTKGATIASACELLLAERKRLTPALADMTADRDFLKRREQDIIEACERVADGGQYRADIVSAINRIRAERDEARAQLSEACQRAQAWERKFDVEAQRVAELEARLDRLHRLLVTDARDWSTGWRDAMIYAIVVGWGDALPDVAARHGWTAETQQSLVEVGPRK